MRAPARRALARGVVAGFVVLAFAAARPAWPQTLVHRSHAVSFSVADFDGNSRLPLLEYRYQRWGRAGLGFDIGLATIGLINEVDLGLIGSVPLGGGYSLTARAGPTGMFSLWGGGLGMVYGARLASRDDHGRGVVFDFSYRTFDDQGDNYPVVSGSVGVVWYGHWSPPAATSR